MKAIIRWAIKNSPAMNMLLIASMLIGSVAMLIMRREIFPEFELEIILISVPYPGASPEDTEQAICEKIEAAVKGMDGIKQMTSIAQENAGFTILELNNNVKNVQKVLNEVRSEIDQIPSFPDTAEDPDVQQIVFKTPAIQVGILGPKDSGLPPDEATFQLRELAEQIRDDLLQLPPAKPAGLRGVFFPLITSTSRPAISTVEIVAARDYQIDVEIPEVNLRNYGLTLDQVSQILRRQNLELPGGKMTTASQELLLRGNNKRTLGHEIEQIVVLSKPNGDVVRLKDLANVKDGFEDTTSEHSIDGRPGMVLTVSRTADEDLLTIVDTVKRYLASKQMPEGYELKVWNDTSIDVRDRIDLLVRNGAQGLVLVFIVLAIFLDLRLAFWVALGIPVSILGAGLALYATGQTINMLSMFAFLMALGIVVDDAIVIGENIYTKRRSGMTFLHASVEGTYEVLPSVFASVTTTIIAFMPLMFVAGVMGKFIAVMPIAVIAMLIISLIESTFILPCHLAHQNNLFLRILGGALYAGKFLLIPLQWVNRLADRWMQWVIDRLYEPFLRFTLVNKVLVFSGAVALLIGTTGLINSGWVPFETFPKLDVRNISGTVVFPDGTSSRFAKQATEELAAALNRVDEQLRRERGESVVEVVYQRVGEVGSGGANPTGVTNGSHVGTVEVELTDSARREISSDEIISRWREEMPVIPGTDVVKFGSQSMGPGGKSIEFRLLAVGKSAEYLEAAAEDCKNYLREIKGVTDVEDDYRLGKYEVLLKLNPEGQAIGLTQEDLYRTVRGSYYGQEAMRLQRGRHDVKLMVRYPEQERKSFQNFEEIRVRDDSGNEIPLTEIADIQFRRPNSEINRINQKRSITVTADVDKNLGANAAVIVADMKQQFFPQLLQRYRKENNATLYVDWEGQAKQQQESFNSMFAGFVVAMFAMYILLTLEFRSYLQPALILLTIPFGVVGAVVGHGLMGLDLTLFSFFGLIALTGVVINDSIVLVDFINHRVDEGLPINEALVEAGRRRFRPIMLTSFTTIAGLSPILLERSLQAQVVIPMAASLVFGLATGTIFILVLIPLYYRAYWSLAGHAS